MNLPRAFRFGVGVDLKAGGVSIAVVGSDGRYTASREWFARPPKSGQRVQVAERLYRVEEVALGILRGFARDCSIGAILVEDPKGRHRAPTLVAAYGVVLAAAYRVGLEIEGGAVVFTEDARAWRRAAGCTSAKGRDPKEGALALATAAGCPARCSEDEHEVTAMAVRALKVLA